ncbi:hypothetical protein [Halorientalis pallida]|uniref:Right handed beta helix region n=1 Tax=Halorientalis pallida TaxID=2479928 RepID=A0A498KUA2_9EURY|nr:hypothetical protein [Halorientalis pallida]RXK46944.1 hypothetical protein EAF64_17510 [Halorientalis pallida]
MVEKTPNHGLNIYSEGDTDWTHSPDMRAIEKRLVIRDQESNLSNYTAHEGAIFIAEDTGAVYDAKQSSWTRASREFESIEVSDATITKSLTYPDGSTTTDSPRGTGTESFKETVAGIVYIDQSGDYVAESFVTNNGPFSGTDAGAVIQSLHDDILNNGATTITGTDVIGKIIFGTGTYTFDTQATITADGVKLHGQADYEWNKEGTTMFQPSSDFPTNPVQGMIRVEGNACSIENITFGFADRDVYGIHIWDSDRHTLRGITNESIGPNGEGLRVSGSYQSTMRDCQFRQAHFRINQVTNKNPNNTIIDNCMFQHSNSGVAPLKYAGNGNEVRGCRINQGDEFPADPGVAGIASSPSGPSKNWVFTDCKIFGSNSGGNMIEGRSLFFNGCTFGGGGDAIFDNLQGTNVVGCIFNINHEVLKFDGSDNQFNRAVFTGNNVNACNSSGNAAFDTVSGNGNNDQVVISGNVFRGGGNYDLDLDPKALRSGQITGNYCMNGINENWGGNYNVKVTENWGHNPVGYQGRSQPSLPSGTNDGTGNFYGQPATVTHDGGKGIKITDGDGNDYTLDSTPSTFAVPRFGTITFTQSVPSAWDWWWH